MRLMIMTTFAICMMGAPVFAVEPGHQIGANDECARLLGYKPLPRLEVAAVEREVSIALADFFNVNPKAQSLFRTAFYGHSRSSVNMTLVAAIQNIPANKRAAVTKSVLLGVSAKEFAGPLEFVEKMIEASLAWNQGPELFQLPTYFYYDLLKILQAAKANRQKVFAFREGQGEFAMLDGAKTTTRYYRLDDKKLEAKPISESEFNSALEWRQRSIPRPAVGWISSALGRVGLGSSSAPKVDRVQAYEQTLSNNLKPMWRYTMNSLSDESYALVAHLLKRGVSDLERNLDPSEVGLASRSLKNFARAIWEEAQRIGYSAELNNDIYAEPELDEILNAFQIMRSSMDGGDFGYRVVKFGNENLYFIKERTADNQLVFRKKTESEFESSQKQEKGRINESLKRYDQIAAITPDADPTHFPEQIIPIPQAHLAALDVALNLGYASIGGFKQPNENLAELIRHDAETVAHKGYTHKQLAEWLTRIVKLSEEKQPIVNLNGRNYEITAMGYMGSQSSPFGDKVAWSRDYIVLDLATGKRIGFSGGHPYMIGYYGFFEGNVPQRLPPAELIEFIEGR